MKSSSIKWAMVLTGAAVFMAGLDNLVVTTALPVIASKLHAGLSELEWVVNAYTLTFAVLLLTGSALGDRFGRRRMFVLGLVVFTAGSAAAALAPSVSFLIVARAVQGAGGALVMPLSLTLLSAAVPVEKRELALGVWGGLGGLSVAVGPVIGGAVTTGLSWQWIFWINVPIGIVVAPLAYRKLRESSGPAGSLDIPGLLLGSAGLFGVVFGLVRSNAHGWGTPGVFGPMMAGVAVLGTFLAWEARATTPMLPLHVFRSRGFSLANSSALLQGIGMFGSVFLLAQFFQVVQHFTPLQSGIRVLPWTGMPVLVAPLAGVLASRFGGRRLLTLGLAMQTVGLVWLAVIGSPDTSYAAFVAPFVISGIGMGLFFVPMSSVVLSTVKRDQEGVASGVNGTMREIGTVLGIAVLGTVFSAHGGYTSGTLFVHGMNAAVGVGAAIVGAGTLASIFVPQAGSVAQQVARATETVSLPKTAGVGSTALEGATEAA